MQHDLSAIDSKYLGGLRRVVLVKSVQSEAHDHLLPYNTAIMLSGKPLVLVDQLLCVTIIYNPSWRCHILETVSKAKQLLGGSSYIPFCIQKY